jgi:uncharacterized protein (DUF58 family)
MSAEFVEYRGYRQGDDTKRIDWKLLARTDRVYIRLSQERTLLPTVVVVDASASLAFPMPSLAKWELTRQLAVGLAAVVRQSGDPVGLVVAHDGVERRVAPSARRSALEEMMRALDVTPEGQPPIATAMRHAARRAARVVVISDFLDETEALLTIGRTFVASGGELYALHIVDQGELDPDPDKLLVEDPEAAMVRRPMSPRTRATYLERFGAWRFQLARDWRNAGAVYAMLVTGQEPFRQAIRRITTRAATTATETR